MQSNIENLIAFWTACGKQEHLLPSGRVLHRSNHWPWRLWLDYEHHPTRQDLEQVLIHANSAEKALTLPQWRSPE